MAAKRKDPTIRMDHMLQAIVGIREAMNNRSITELSGDWVRRSAVERGFEIISEASRHIPEELKATEPEIPWKDIAGIGNILRHDYDGAQLAILYDASLSDLPPLEAALARMKERCKGS